MENKVYFISGIDTNIGKSYATGYLAREWNAKGIRTITQKMIQTGNSHVAEDVKLHRHIVGCGWLPEGDERLTMPEVFTYPCSPHLASEIDKRAINFNKIKYATQQLSERFDAVLLEGAGGLMVPLTRKYLTIDYIQDNQYPLILVVSGRLGSINHILLSLEAVQKRNIQLHTLIYNLYEDRDGDPIIREDTKTFIHQYIKDFFPETKIMELPLIDL